MAYNSILEVHRPACVSLNLSSVWDAQIGSDFLNRVLREPACFALKHILGLGYKYARVERAAQSYWDGPIFRLH